MKQPFVAVTDIVAWLEDYHFPASFTWRTKLNHVLERYEPDTTQFFKNTITPGMTVVDVGANLGYFTRLAASLVGPTGSVYAFEPDEENFLLLKKNTEHLTNVHTIRSAVSDTEGAVTFYLSNKMGMHSLLEKNGSGRSVTVPSTTLDRLYEKTDIHFVKIDVEGAEESVFHGMKKLLSRKPIIVFEYNPWDSKALVDELEKSHAIFKILRGGMLERTMTEASRLDGKKGTNLVLMDS
ncbi:MAG: FkbM family methyltransferase [Patescibacteria group bacterium]